MPRVYQTARHLLLPLGYRSFARLSGWAGFAETAGYWSIRALEAETASSPEHVNAAFIEKISHRYGVPLQLSYRIIWIESRGHHTGPDGKVITSAKGALGIMQIMPDTARELHINPLQARENIQGGLMYLARLSRKYKGNWHKAIAAYNWGQGHIDSAVVQFGENWHNALPHESASYLTQARADNR